MISRMPPKKQTPAQTLNISSTVSAGGGAVAGSGSGKKKSVVIVNQPPVTVDVPPVSVAPAVKDDDEDIEAEVEEEDDVFGPDEEDTDIVEDEDVQKDDDEQKEEDEEEEEEEQDDEEEEEDEDGNIRRKPKKKSKKGGNVVPVIGLGAVEDVDEEPVLMDDDYIQRVHPEMILPDTKELQEIMRSYTREEDPVQRKSRPILSKYEATSIIGMRAQQIIRGSTPFIDSTEVNPIDIALEELRAKLIPIIVRRVMPDGVSEYWRLTELTYYE
jgi:DNA-directed RNA polymerase subunit K/omega